MTAITAELVPDRDVTYERSSVSHFVTDVWVLTKRSIARIRREPETLADVTIMPVIFILMFAYVFGGAILLPGHGSYHEYLIGGMLGMGLAPIALGGAGGTVHRRPAHPAHRRGRRGLRRAGHRLAGAHRPGRRGRGARASAAVRLRVHRGGSLPGHGPAQPGGGAGDRVHHLPAADVRIQRVRADPGHAGLAATGGGVEPDVRAGRRVPAAVRQPEPGRLGALLADAAPRARGGLLVRGDHPRLRAASGPPVPAQGPRLRRPPRELTNRMKPEIHGVRTHLDSGFHAVPGYLTFLNGRTHRALLI